MDQIIILDIGFQFPGGGDAIHPLVLKSADAMVLVDCGYPGFMPDIEEAVRKAGLQMDGLTHIVLTHHDFDHMGAASAFLKKYPAVKIVASKKEAPYISGKEVSPRLTQALEMQKNLPKNKQAFGRRFCEIVSGVQPVRVDIKVTEADRFDWCGGVRVIETPGHTPGHISLFLEKEETLVTGDAAVVEEGRLAVANPAFTLDMAGAESSLQKIKNFGAKKIICYHGGLFDPERA